MSEPRFSLSQTSLLRHGILGYWTIFWLFNVLDKIIGGAHFLWVGRDRFAPVSYTHLTLPTKA
mgnify:CR=1 FL=1